jgi:transcription elongation factor
MIGSLTSAAEGLRSARVGVGKAASDVVRSAQSASNAYQQTAAAASRTSASSSGSATPRYTPPLAPSTQAQSPDLAVATVNLTRAEFAYKATAQAFKAQAEIVETLLDTVI